MRATASQLRLNCILGHCTLPDEALSFYKLCGVAQRQVPSKFEAVSLQLLPRLSIMKVYVGFPGLAQKMLHNPLSTH